MFKIYRSDIENKDIIESYLRYNQYPVCEFSVANNILWSKLYGSGFIITEDMLAFTIEKNGKIESFSAPVGAHDPKPAFDSIVSYCQENEIEFKMILVCEELFSSIEKWYPGEYKLEYNRDDADYLYKRETLSTLAGKKLHGKRNHINRFLENYPDFVYEEINDENAAECLELAGNWEETSSTGDDLVREYEVKAVEYALMHRSELGLEGALIRADNRAVAFTLGERLTRDTFVIHFEKAYAEVQGAYPMINREFVRRRLTEYKYINREEDMGIPGLRHAKTSYQPIRLVEKGIVTRV